MERTKYMALFCKTKSGNEILKIVSLGNLKSPKRSVLTKNTYAFKEFSSYLPIEDVAHDFFNSEECYNSVTFYIGKEFSYKSFKESFPNEYINPELIGKSSVIIKSQCVDGKSESIIITERFKAYRSISRPEIYRQYDVVSSTVLSEDYDTMTVLL